MCPKCRQPVQQQPQDNPKQASEPQQQGSYSVILRLLDGTTFVLTGEKEYVLGRRSKQAADYKLDVDLSPWSPEQVVSRQHAKIVLRRAGVFVADLKSDNKTFQNGFRLQAGQEYPLHDNDTLVLGNLPIGITIRPDSEAIE